MKSGLVIAVDGPSGVGKSSVSRLVARRLGLKYVDTGAMYRAFAVGALEDGIDTASEDELSKYAKNVAIDFDESGERVFLNGRELSAKIREPWVGELTSRVSSIGVVREFLVGLQRRIDSDVVMEGRDIGTIVFPDADIKVFLDASGEVRAKRRHKEYSDEEKQSNGKAESIETVTKQIESRDRRDSSRENSPLKKAEDAVYIDTTQLSIEEVAEKIISALEEKNQ